MSKFTVQMQEPGRCQIHHELAQADILTDLPPEYGGNGRSFSSTDLVSAALGSCTMTAIDGIIERAGHDPKLIKIQVSKTLGQAPKMISHIELVIGHPDPFDEKLLKKLMKAAQSCPVRRSLNAEVTIDTIFKTGEQFTG